MRKHSNTPFFYILTTTYNRPELLERSIASVQHQTYTHFKHIIANDSESTDSYEKVRNVLQRDNIRYTENKINQGKNKTLNELLAYVSTQKDIENSFVIYLDDDDWLHQNALKDFVDTIKNTSKQWVVSMRTLANGDVLTKNKTGKLNLSYQMDYLLLKRFTGDATHCIYSPIAIQAQYAESKKNGEEWIYFCQIDKLTDGFFFLNTTGTFTNGYLPGGVTNKYETPPFVDLLHEVTKRRIISPPIIIYLILRKIKHLLLSITNFK